jgi:hypothetical protein
MKLLLAFLITLFLLGCGNNNLYNDQDTPHLSMTLHLVPEAFFGPDGWMLAPRDMAVLSVGDQVEFWGIIRLGDSLLTEDQLSISTSLSYWVLGSDTLYGSKTRRTFSKPETVVAIFNQVELGGDTLRDTMMVYVNSNLKVDLQAPQDKQLDVMPNTHGGLPFVWSLQGVDSWESVTSYLFLGADPLTLLDQEPIASTSGTELRLGATDPCPQDSYCQFYWRIIAVTSSGISGILDQTDTSEIRYFRTRRPDTDSAEAKVQVWQVATGLGLGAYVKSVDQSGIHSIPWSLDTLTGTASSPLLSPGLWTVIAGDSLHPEFRPDSMLLDLSPGSLNLPEVGLDIVDVIPPQVILQGSPSRSPFNDSLTFTVSDFGSGVDWNSPFTNWSASQFSFGDGKVTLKWTTLSSADLLMDWHITVSDHSGNSNLHCTFKLSAVSASEVLFKGPYCDPDLIVPVEAQ